MQSIVSYQSEKERKRAAVRKGRSPCTGNLPRVSEAFITYTTVSSGGKVIEFLLLQPVDKRKSKIPKAPITVSRPKSTASFKPSALSIKQASFNFPTNGAKPIDKKAPKLGKDELHA
jgi:hypothetical protein